MPGKAQFGDGSQILGLSIAHLFPVGEQVIGDANKQVLEWIAKAFQAAVVGVLAGHLLVALFKPLHAAAIHGPDLQVHGFTIGLVDSAGDIEVHNHIAVGSDPDGAPGTTLFQYLAQLIGKVDRLGVAHLGKDGVIFISKVKTVVEGRDADIQQCFGGK